MAIKSFTERDERGELPEFLLPEYKNLIDPTQDTSFSPESPLVLPDCFLLYKVTLQKFALQNIVLTGICRKERQMLPKNTHILPAIFTLSVIGYCVSLIPTLQLKVNFDTTQIFNEQIDAVDAKDNVTTKNLSCELSNNKLNQKVVSEVFTISHYQLQRLLIK